MENGFVEENDYEKLETNSQKLNKVVEAIRYSRTVHTIVGSILLYLSLYAPIYALFDYWLNPSPVDVFDWAAPLIDAFFSWLAIPIGFFICPLFWVKYSDHKNLLNRFYNPRKTLGMILTMIASGVVIASQLAIIALCVCYYIYAPNFFFGNTTKHVHAGIYIAKAGVVAILGLVALIYQAFSAFEFGRSLLKGDKKETEELNDIQSKNSVHG